MFSKLLLALSLIATLLHFSSCIGAIAVSSSQKQQTVTFQLPNEKSKLYINDSLYGQGTSLEIKVPKRFDTQLRVETEGYRTIHGVLPLYKRASKRGLAWLDIPVTMGLTWTFIKSIDSRNINLGLIMGGITGLAVMLPIDLSMTKKNANAFKYPSSQNFKKPYPNLQKQKEQKDVAINYVGFEVPKEKNTFKFTQAKKYFKNPEKTEKEAKNTPSSTGKLEGESSKLSDFLNEELLRGGFIDSINRNLLKSKTNGIYLEGRITEIEQVLVNNVLSDYTIVLVGGVRTTVPIFRGYFYYKFNCKWTVKDAYDETKKEFVIKSNSDLFAIKDSAAQDSFVSKSLENASLNNLYQLFENQEFKELLKIENINGNANTIVQNINRPAQKPQSFEDAMQACATILVEKNKEKGHGSGFFISTDGYLITNYHVVAKMDKIMVKTNDGKTHSAKVLRFDFENDLALLKIEATSPFAFEIPNDKNYKIGIDAFTIGTPSYESLGQTLSKGILSGVRTSEAGNEVLQTDVSVNPGNSGGPLLNKEFQLIGVVNSKLMGRGVEGIAFGSAAKDLLKQLNLAY